MTEPRTLSADVAQTRAALPARLRERFDAALPGARAAVLARLLGALDREPLPGVRSRTRDGVERVRLHDGRVIEFPVADGRPFAEPDAGRTAHLTWPDGEQTAHLSRPDGEQTAHLAWPDAGRTAYLTWPVAGAGSTVHDGHEAIHRAATRRAMIRSGGDRYPLAHPDEDRHPTHAGHADIADPGTLARSLWPGAPLAAEIDNSVANLALARAAQPTAAPPSGQHVGHPAARPVGGPVAAPAGPGDVLAAAAGDPDGLGRLEQLVVDGHPLHPCCRTRGGMSTADVLAYAPEHRPVIRLRRLRVPPGRWYGDTPPLLYAHPWQADRLRDVYPWLTGDGETGPVRPLMSLRTVAPVGGGDHYKTAVDVQMTSALRTVSPAAVHNGPRLSALLATLTADLPLTALAETAAGAVLVDGQPHRHLAHLRRQAPGAGPGEVVLPLGACAVPGLLRALAGTDPYRWFGDLARILWTPLVTVLHRGVALEAHGQNTLVVLRDGSPARILYRDLGGVRVSERRLRAAGIEPPGLRGDLPSDDPAVLRTKLAAAALSTVAAQLIALLARDGADPARLWRTVAAAVRAAGTPDVPHLLREPLPVKAMTAMRLAADPLDDIWTSIDNPLVEWA